MRFSFGSDNSSEKALKQAEKFAQQGKYAQAVDEYLKVVEANPGDVTLLNTVGDMCVRANRNDEAMRFFARVADHYATEKAVPSAIAVYKKILKIDGNNHDAGIKLAELYTRQGLLPEARRQYSSVADAYIRMGQPLYALKIRKKLTDLDPENTALKLEFADECRQAGTVQEAYQAYIQAGQELQRKGRLDESIDAFQKALDVKPDSKIALNALADGFARMGNIPHALKLIDPMLDKNPTDVDLLTILGRTYLSAKMLDEAEGTFNRVLTLDKTRFESLLDVGRAYVEQRNFDRAIAVVQSCVEPAIARGQKKKLTAILKEILRRDPRHLGALQRLADIYSRVDERRNLVTTLNSLVEAASRRGMKDIASNALKKLVEIEPDVPYPPVGETPDAEPQSQRPSAPTPANLPEGFESGPMLMEWAKMVKTPADGDIERPFRDTEQNRPAASTTVTVGDMEIERPFNQMEAERAAQPGTPIAQSVGNTTDYSMELMDSNLNQHPEFRAARIKLMEEMVASQPKYVVGRQKLKQLYVENRQLDKAAAQCLDLARLFEEKGDKEKAKEYLTEAYDLQPSVSNLSAQVAAVPAPPPPPEERLDLGEMFTLEEFNKYFDREWRRAIRDGKTVGLIKLEVDHFNNYLDTYGLLSGDYCLERVAAALEGELLRPGDLISSAGGGCFFVLLPDTPTEAASVVAERLRAKVEALHILHENSPSGNLVSLSLGVASALPIPAYSSDALLSSADEALVQAKIEGGNRFVVAAPLSV